MHISDKAPDWFWRSAAILLSLQLFVFVFGLGPFRCGYWLNQEPRLFAIFIISAAGCVWLCWGLMKQWLNLRPVPAMGIILLAWVGWQIIVTIIAAPSTWRSWFGPPDFGEGTSWHICLLVTVILAYGLWSHSTYRAYILKVALLSAGLAFFLQLTLPPENAWKPNLWSDYLAFIIGWCWALLLAARPELAVERQFKIGLAVLLLVLLTHNGTASLFLCVAFMVSQGTAEIACDRRKHHLTVTKSVRALAIIVCLLPMLYVFGSSYLSSTFTKYRDSSVLRIHLNTVALEAIRHDPSRLMLGKGWDSFQDAHIQFAIHDNVRVFQKGELAANVESLFSGAMHSHNQPLEILLSLGVPGLALWLLLSSYIIIALPERYFWRLAPIHVALILTSYFWFYLSFLLPFYAVYLAMLIQLCEPKVEKKRMDAVAQNQAWQILLCLAAIPALLWSALAQFGAMQYADWLNRVVREPYQNYFMDAVLEDSSRGGERFNTIVNGLLTQTSDIVRYPILVKQGETSPPPPALPADNYLWIEKLLVAAHTMGSNIHLGAMARNTDLMIQFFLQTPQAASPTLDGARALSFEMYPDTIVRAAKELPLREDFAAPYFYHLEKEQKNQIIVEMADKLLSVNPRHRVALWLKGKMLRDHPHTASEGTAMMQRAYDAGVGAVYPITEAEESAFEK